MRKSLFWLHLGAGLTAGVVIVIMSFTGTLLMYEKQIATWADGYRVEPPPVGASISVERLLTSAMKARPGGIPVSVTVVAEAAGGRPASVSLGRSGTLYLDPYTGQVFGEGATGVRAFFRSLTDWHRWLALQGESRATGRSITGAANLLFLFIVTSGVYLWWPRSQTRASFRSVTLLRGGLVGRARDFNWHNVFGFWSALPLFFIVASAVTMSYPWANDLLYRITGNEPPPRPAGRAPAPASAPAASPLTPPAPAPAPTPDVTGLDNLWALAAKSTPGWHTLSLRIPESPADPVTFAIDTSTGAARPDLRSQIVLERATGALIRHETYASQNGGRQMRTWARWIHTGEAFGVPGQTVAGLASAFVLLLAWTGGSLAWRRFGAWRARRARP